MKKRITEEVNLNVDGDNKKLFTPGFEAFIVTQMDNNLQRWNNRVEWWKAKKDWEKKLPTKIRKKKGEAKPSNPCHDAKYSIDDGGRESYCTWEDKGLEMFATTRAAITKIRKEHTKQYVQFEKNFLKYLQSKAPTEADNSSKTAKSERKLGENTETAREQKKKRASFVVEIEDDDVDLADSDDDDDEEESTKSDTPDE